MHFVRCRHNSDLRVRRNILLTKFEIVRILSTEQWLNLPINVSARLGLLASGADVQKIISAPRKIDSKITDVDNDRSLTEIEKFHISLMMRCWAQILDSMNLLRGVSAGETQFFKYYFHFHFKQTMFYVFVLISFYFFLYF